MKTPGLAVMTVLFSVPELDFSSLTNTITKIEGPWLDRMPQSMKGKLILSSGPHEAQGQYFRIVGPETTTFHLSNGKKEKQVHVFNTLDHKQEYVICLIWPAAIAVSGLSIHLWITKSLSMMIEPHPFYAWLPQDLKTVTFLKHLKILCSCGSQTHVTYIHVTPHANSGRFLKSVLW
jgi:hypothetical protein